VNVIKDNVIHLLEFAGELAYIKVAGNVLPCPSQKNDTLFFTSFFSWQESTGPVKVVLYTELSRLSVGTG
jgi:hypothetical protein